MKMLPFWLNFGGKSDPWDAKLKMGHFLLSGHEAVVKQALKNAGN
jgi:hypothetical protein